MSIDLWDDMQDRYTEFSEAVLEGHMLAEAWWTKQGRLTPGCKILFAGERALTGFLR